MTQATKERWTLTTIFLCEHETDREGEKERGEGRVKSDTQCERIKDAEKTDTVSDADADDQCIE